MEAYEDTGKNYMKWARIAATKDTERSGKIILKSLLQLGNDSLCSSYANQVEFNSFLHSMIPVFLEAEKDT